jgi:LDH2 family malate/lactate/ureidoglycolate dehydrogenase
MGDGTVVLRSDGLRRLTKATIAALGASEPVAANVSDHLVDSNLAGHDSHGVHLLSSYVEAARRREIHPEAEAHVERERGASALVSGEWGFGQHTGRVAMDVATRLAGNVGIGIVGMVRINHLGRIGSYMEQAAASGCAALAFVSGLGGSVQAAPYGGSRGAYGANPFAAAFPAGHDDRLIIDYATTQLAGGKVLLAKTKGESLPAGVLIDAAGRDSTDPEDLYRGGALLPFGGHKGYALAVLVELLGRVITGSDSLGAPLGGGENFGRSGATFVAIDIGVFRDRGDSTAAAAATLANIREVRAADGFDRVRTPGDPEADSRAARLRDGIAVPTETLEAIVAAAESVGVDADLVSAVSRGGTRS